MVVGVVGKSGSGKNQVSEYIEMMFDYTSFDLDLYGHRFLINNRDRVNDALGITSSGSIIIDRSRIADIVFHDKKKLKILETMSHQWIEDKILEETDSLKGDIVLNAALLNKSTLYDKCDLIVFVEASFTTRMKRLSKRDTGKTVFQILSRMRNQKSVNSKAYIDKKIPCHVLYNDKSLDMLSGCLEDFRYLLTTVPEKI